ncbi:MAG TPA: hypothetical protein VGH90_07230 [Chthoniobacteraceae bacterium]|jgi:hypothetical protein
MNRAASVSKAGAALFVIALVATLATSIAQIPLPAGTDLFSAEAAPASGLPGYPHTLLLRHGGQLRGEVVSLDKDFVIWRRPDAHQPLKFNRGEIRRIVFGEAEKLENIAPTIANAAGRPLICTAKLAAGDWLSGTASSKDGETYHLQVAPELEFSLSRAQLEWLQFGRSPAPAFGFFGSLADLECRGGPADPTPAKMAGAILVLPSRNQLRRAFAAQTRLEIDLAINEKDAPGVRVELDTSASQPDDPKENIAFRFDENAIDCTWGRYQAERSESLRSAEKRETAPALYRIFYDGPGGWLALYRNNRQVFNWRLNVPSFGAKGAPQAVHGPFTLEQTRVDSIRIFRDREEKTGPLRLSRLEVSPWDGLLPGPRREALHDDIYSLGKKLPISGKIGALAADQLTFSDTSAPLQDGVFLELQRKPELGFSPDSRVLFGPGGELSTAELRIENGRTSCKTALGVEQIPISALRVISLLDVGGPRGAGQDYLVFKDGDELRGKMVSASSGESIRWRMPVGQEVDFETKLVAGIRFAPQKVDVANAQTLELRNGDRLSGKLQSFDAEKFHFTSSTFGELTGDARQFRSLCLLPKLTPKNGGMNSADWILGAYQKDQAEANDDAAPPMFRNAWLALDDRYVFRDGREAPFDTSEAKLVSPFSVDLQMFQISFDVANLGGRPPAFDFALESKVEVTSRKANAVEIEMPSLYASFDYPKFELASAGSPTPHGSDIHEKLSKQTSRVAFAIYVNTVEGAVNAFLNGIPAGRFGRKKSDDLVEFNGNVLLAAMPPHPPGTVFSKIRIGPWNGLLPNESHGEPHISFSNGDSAAGVPKELHDGKLFLQTDAGQLDFPIERVETIEFSGADQPPPVLGRLRLFNGDILNVDRFHWDAVGVSAHSPIYGDVTVPTTAVSELIVDSALLRPSK